MQCAWAHFPQQKGLVTGLVQTGNGLAPLLLSYGVSIMANPSGQAPEKKTPSSDPIFGHDVAKNVR
jgi:hypothetical protein